MMVDSLSALPLLRLLVIESGGQQVHVCVAHRKAVSDPWQRHERTQEGGSASSVHLIPTAMDLLKEVGFALSDLSAIAFGQGPGSFTGLRSACAVAQGLAISAKPEGLPLIPVPSLWGLALTGRRMATPAQGAVVWSCLDARMGEIYAASYRVQAEGVAPEKMTHEALYTPEALVHAVHQSFLNEPSVVCVGNALPLLQPLTGILDQVSWVATDVLAWDMVDVAAHLALQGSMVKPEDAMPLYVRDKVAFTTAEREAQKASQEG